MEEVKLWAIDGSQAEDLKPTSQTEKLLENALVSRPDLLLEDLTLVGRQTPTEGGLLDLLGVDGDGRLVVFELKRGTLSRDAVAQIIDYASDLDRMDLDTLANHISQSSGNYGIEKIEDFQSWYTEDLGFEDLESLKPLRMFLVGLGVDDRTERMVKFLAENSGMDISLLTFYGFNYDIKTILAKRVQVAGAKHFNLQSKRSRPLFDWGSGDAEVHLNIGANGNMRKWAYPCGASYQPSKGIGHTARPGNSVGYNKLTCKVCQSAWESQNAGRDS